MRSMANRIWKYSGCSAHRQPSLSKVAMRSANGTKSGEPCFVTRSTNATIACLGAVLFQDGSGSWARAGAVQDVVIRPTTAMRARSIQNGFMVVSRDPLGDSRRANESSVGIGVVFRLLSLSG